MVDVAQLVRAPDCGSGGHGFKSHHPPNFPGSNLHQNLSANFFEAGVN